MISLTWLVAMRPSVANLIAKTSSPAKVRPPPLSTHLLPFDAKEPPMPKTTPAQNKALVLEAFDTLFNRRDYAAAERFWSDRYVQHSAHIALGREGLFDLIRAAQGTLR